MTTHVSLVDLANGATEPLNVRDQPTEAQTERQMEASRLARRRSIRKAIAERDLLKRRADALNERIASLQRERGIADAEHEKTKESLLRELWTVEAKIVDLATDRKAIPEKLDAQRRELLRQIDDATEAHKEAIARIDRSLTAPTAERDNLLMQTASGAALEYSLSQGDVACPKLFAEFFSAREAVRWSSERAQVADKKVAEYQRSVKNGEVLDATYHMHGRNWQAELEAANEAHNLATVESLKLQQQIMDE